MIIGIVGMSGAGKSIVAEYFQKAGYGYIRLGQITMDIIREKGLEPTEENERPIRENLRKEHGMAAYAILNFPKIENLDKKGHVVIDGIYSWEEYLEFKKRYGNKFYTISVFASPDTRYDRLEKRSFDMQKDADMKYRPLTREKAEQRDRSEIENLSKAGPIVMADYTIVNEGTIDELYTEVDYLIDKFK